MISIAFFANKGGVGKTLLVYHAAWMLAKLGYRVLAVDLDPKSSLSLMALGEKRLGALWSDTLHHRTMYGAVAPLFNGTGDIDLFHIETLSENLSLLVGDGRLSYIEDGLATQWSKCLTGNERAFRVVTAFGRVIQEAAQRHNADLVLIDMDSSLGSFNRAALLAASHVVIPTMLDSFSVHGIRNLGPMLRRWRQAWQAALAKAPAALGELSQGQITPIGYVLIQHAEHSDQLAEVYAKWQTRLSGSYLESVLGEQGTAAMPDANQIQIIKHYSSLMLMAMEARKPMFDLTLADGAIGAHQANVQQCHEDFKQLCHAIAQRVGIEALQGNL